MAHKPRVFIDECNSDCSVLRISDISEYDSLVAITNPVLKINLPGNNTDFVVPFPINGTGFYTTVSFGSCNTSTLPDGIYSVTYSVCPNEEVFYTKKFLRTCQTECIIYSLLANILGAGCNKVVTDCYGKDITNERIQELEDMLTLLETAKSDVGANKYSLACEKLNYVNGKIQNL